MPANSRENVIVSTAPVPMSEATYQRLFSELQRINTAIKTKTAELGTTLENAADWHDNAVYDHLLQELDTLEARAKSISESLKHSQIIEPRKDTADIRIGNSVEVKMSDSFQTELFTIMGPHDNNTHADWISLHSPLAQALLGKRPGDIVTLSNGIVVEIILVLPGAF